MSLRDETDPMYKWKIEDLFETDEKWKKAYEEVNGSANKIESFKGKLENPDDLLNCLQNRDEISQKCEKVYVYATMKMHEDTSDGKYQAMAEQAETLLVKLTAAMAFIEPEILLLNKSFVEKSLKENKGLELYEHYLNDIFRIKEHTLSPEMEELLAKAEDIASASESIFSMMNDADMEFGTVKDENGNEVEITHGRYASLMESKNREVRQNSFNKLYDAYLKQKNTLAATFNANVKKDLFFAKAKKYDSSLDLALDTYNIPKEVYTNLINTVSDNLHLMYRYIELRKKFLKLPELHMYDLATPLIKEANTDINYDDAKQTVLEALSVLGDEYKGIVKECLEKGWIDVYENKGKRSGAYSWGAYGTHPYILLNYDNKISDMFTLAHEIGHSIHSHYSWETQPYVYGSYSIFVAEVASTVNECLLMEYLIKNTKDEALKKYLINYSLEQFRGTVFRQTMFAEFEMITHELLQKGEALTHEVLSEIYYGLNKKYYGENMVIDDKIRIEWARIPHFYSAFYVYQYSTGYSAAVALSEGIMNKGGQAVSNYIGFLKGGCSDYSINLLKGAGVDMSSPKPVLEALNKFEKLLDEMESFL